MLIFIYPIAAVLKANILKIDLKISIQSVKLKHFGSKLSQITAEVTQSS